MCGREEEYVEENKLRSYFVAKQALNKRQLKDMIKTCFPFCKFQLKKHRRELVPVLWRKQPCHLADGDGIAFPRVTVNGCVKMKKYA